MEDARNMEVQVEEEEEEEEEEEVILKQEVACHPRFGILKEAHLKLLKVCLGDEDDDADQEKEDSIVQGAHHEAQLDHSGIENEVSVSVSELDLFMEAYCMALIELKKSVEEPIREASSFVEFMHYLLLHDDDPSGTIFPTPSSPGEEEDGEEVQKVEEAFGEELMKKLRIN